jgi:hypothetical protein
MTVHYTASDMRRSAPLAICGGFAKRFGRAGGGA